MPAKQLRCDVSVILEGDRTGENAVECGAVALPCVDCGDSAGCEEHSMFCPRCGRAVCVYCAEDHACIAETRERAA